MTSLIEVSVSAPPDATADARWAAWVLRGAEHDRTVKRRFIVTATALAAGIASWLILLLVSR